MRNHKRWCATQTPIPFGAVAERGPCNCGKRAADMRAALKHHVTGAIARGEAVAIIEQRERS